MGLTSLVYYTWVVLSGSWECERDEVLLLLRIPPSFSAIHHVLLLPELLLKSPIYPFLTWWRSCLLAAFSLFASLLLYTQAQGCFDKSLQDRFVTCSSVFMGHPVKLPRLVFFSLNRPWLATPKNQSFGFPSEIDVLQLLLYISQVALSRVGTSWDVPKPFRSTYIFEYFLV